MYGPTNHVYLQLTFYLTCFIIYLFFPLLSSLVPPTNLPPFTPPLNSPSIHPSIHPSYILYLFLWRALIHRLQPWTAPGIYHRSQIQNKGLKFTCETLCRDVPPQLNFLGLIYRPIALVGRLSTLIHQPLHKEGLRCAGAVIGISIRISSSGGEQIIEERMVLVPRSWRLTRQSEAINVHMVQLFAVHWNISIFWNVE